MKTANIMYPSVTVPVAAAAAAMLTRVHRQPY